MLKKVSDNIINLLKHFNITKVDIEVFDDFMSNHISCEICSLVEDEETNGFKIDHKLLDDLEDAIDELNDYLPEEIDLEDINSRLSN